MTSVMDFPFPRNAGYMGWNRRRWKPARPRNYLRAGLFGLRPRGAAPCSDRWSGRVSAGVRREAARSGEGVDVGQRDFGLGVVLAAWRRLDGERLCELRRGAQLAGQTSDGCKRIVEDARQRGHAARKPLLSRRAQ